MAEFFAKVWELSYWDKFTDFHGALAMLPLVLFGAAFALYFSLGKLPQALRWLKWTLYALAIDLIALNAVGLYIYVPYRAPGGPRTILKSSPDTAWLHEVIFEHKEFLAYAPWLLAAGAIVLLWVYGDRIREPGQRRMKQALFVSLAAALVIVLAVAAEAVLVTKAVPLK